MISLSRLWQRQGKRYEACNILFTICNCFAGDIDIVDMKETQASFDPLGEGGLMELREVLDRVRD